MSTHGCRDGELARAALVRNFRGVPEAGRGSFYPQGARALCARDVGWLLRGLNVHARVLFWRTELGSGVCGSFVAARRWNGASGRGVSLCGGYGGRCLRVLCPGNAPRRPAMSVLGSGGGRVGAGVGRVVCAELTASGQSVGGGGGEAGGVAGWGGRRGGGGLGGRQPMVGPPARPEPHIWNCLGAGTGTRAVPGCPM